MASEPSGKYGFFINADICTGCKACMTACMDRNDLQDDEKFRKVYEFVGGRFSAHDDGTYTTTSFAYYVSLTCQQCDGPACMLACPEHAIARSDDNIIYVMPDKCTSLGKCIEACPYHHPTWDRTTGKMKKCTLCTDEVTEDGIPHPACVDACPVRALDFGPIEEMRKEYGTNVVVGTFDDSTKPNMVANPHRMADGSGVLVTPYGLANSAEVNR